MPSCSLLGGRPAGTEGPGSPDRAGAVAGGSTRAVAGGEQTSTVDGGRWAGKGPARGVKTAAGLRRTPQAGGRSGEDRTGGRWAAPAGRPFS